MKSLDNPDWFYIHRFQALCFDVFPSYHKISTKINGSLTKLIYSSHLFFKKKVIISFHSKQSMQLEDTHVVWE